MHLLTNILADYIVQIGFRICNRYAHQVSQLRLPRRQSQEEQRHQHALVRGLHNVFLYAFNIILFRFFDSDIEISTDGESDSDGRHSAHSLEFRSPTKPSRKDSRAESKPVYLDSFPDITDSGIKRNKEILNNPLILGEDVIDPLLRDNHRSLPTLRHV